MTALVQKKLDLLRGILRGYGGVVVAYSGGLDSTFLLKVARDVLGDKAVAVTACSSTYPEREFKEAVKQAKEIGAAHVVIESEELAIKGFAENPVNRCYFCKKELFSKLLAVAKKHGLSHVADGSNVDDLGDFRPGRDAATECGVVSPLIEAGLTKSDVRKLSKKLGLATWDKPSFACLSSRFPYGHAITPEKLGMVEQAENLLLSLGVRQVRVRHHGDTARIEVEAKEIPRLLSGPQRQKIVSALKEIGFTYVTVDLEGYRTGSMNQVVKKNGQCVSSRRLPAQG
jgi:uncharacterized protein